jgi:hypothetical protein
VPRSGTTLGEFVVLDVVTPSSVWVGDDSSLLWHWSSGRWHVLTGRNGQSPVQLATYGSDGMWADSGDVWTGRAWISVGTQGGQLTPEGLASAPRSTQAWLVGNTPTGPEVLRAG